MEHGMLTRIKKEITRRKSNQASIEPPYADAKLSSKLSEYLKHINDSAEEGRKSTRLVSTIRRRVTIDDDRRKVDPNPITKCSLFRVPKKLRELDPAAYDPKLVSIGPFHADNISLQAMDEHKLRYLLYILNTCDKQDSAARHREQAEPSNPGSTIMETLVKAMKNLEWATRNCYNESFPETSSEDFVMMMVFDGCFVIQLLRFYYYSNFRQIDVDDPIFTERWMLPFLQNDLFMLENQLPLFVLDKLYELTRICGEPSLIELTLRFFNTVLPRDNEFIEKSISRIPRQYDHLLAVFRSSFTSSLSPSTSSRRKELRVDDYDYAVFLRSSTQSSQTTIQPQAVEHPSEFTIAIQYLEPKLIGTPSRRFSLCTEKPLTLEKRLVHSVSELEEEGVTFKRMNDRDLLDIQFIEGKGVLEIPPLLIDNYTKPLFRNMVTYEQCRRHNRDFHFTHYILFLDGLVNSPRDVQILHFKGIIDHVLGRDDEVSSLINQLSKGVVYDVKDCYLTKHLKEIRNYTGTRWHAWRASLIHVYFNNPWSFISLLAAFVLLCLTIVQTVYSVLSYY